MLSRKALQVEHNSYCDELLLWQKFLSNYKCALQNSVEIIMEKWDILNCHPCYLPFEEGMTLHWNIFESHLLKDALFQEHMKMVLILRFVKSLLKVESLSPKDVLCQFRLKLVQWYWRRKFKFRQCIFTSSLFPFLSPDGKGLDRSFEQIRIPSPKDVFCQVWLKLTLWFWRRRNFLNFVIYWK